MPFNMRRDQCNKEVLEEMVQENPCLKSQNVHTLQLLEPKCLEEIVRTAVERQGAVLVFVPVELRDDVLWRHAE